MGTSDDAERLIAENIREAVKALNTLALDAATKGVFVSYRTYEKNAIGRLLGVPVLEVSVIKDI